MPFRLGYPNLASQIYRFLNILHSFSSFKRTDLRKPKPPLHCMNKEARASSRHSQNRSAQWFCSSCSPLLCYIYTSSQLTEHGSDGSFETKSVPKNATLDRCCGRCDQGPRCGVPGSEGPSEREMSKGKAKGQENVHSSLLSNQENERLDVLLGRRCVVSENTSFYKLKWKFPQIECWINGKIFIVKSFMFATVSMFMHTRSQRRDVCCTGHRCERCYVWCLSKVKATLGCIHLAFTSLRSLFIFSLQNDQNRLRYNTSL